MASTSPYAGLDENIPILLFKTRTCRDQKQALVRWKPGHTADDSNPQVHSIIQRGRDRRALVRWKGICCFLLHARVCARH